VQDHTASAASHRDEGPEISSDWRFSQIQTGVSGIPQHCQGAEVLDWSPNICEKLFYRPRGDFIIFRAWNFWIGVERRQAELAPNVFTSDIQLVSKVLPIISTAWNVYARSRCRISGQHYKVFSKLTVTQHSGN